MYSVYIIYSATLDKFYIGFTGNLPDRITKHNNISKGFTSKGKPWILRYAESFTDKHDAMRREKQLKAWKNRQRIEQLIDKGSEHPD